MVLDLTHEKMNEETLTIMEELAHTNNLHAKVQALFNGVIGLPLRIKLMSQKIGPFCTHASAHQWIPRSTQILAKSSIMFIKCWATFIYFRTKSEMDNFAELLGRSSRI